MDTDGGGWTVSSVRYGHGRGRVETDGVGRTISLVRYGYGRGRVETDEVGWTISMVRYGNGRGRVDDKFGVIWIRTGKMDGKSGATW